MEIIKFILASTILIACIAWMLLLVCIVSIFILSGIKFMVVTHKMKGIDTDKVMQEKYTSLVQRIEACPKDTDTGEYIVDLELYRDIEEWKHGPWAEVRKVYGFSPKDEHGQPKRSSFTVRLHKSEEKYGTKF